MLLEGLMEALKTTAFTIIIPTLTVANIYTINKNRLILKRNSLYNNRLIKNFQVKKNISIEELKKKINKDKIKVLLPYVEKLEQFTDKENLYSVYRNLKNVRIKRNILILLKVNAGEYTALNNTIEFALLSSLGHEFLHLASSYCNVESGLDLSGFEQYSYVDKVIIGTGLNEGYTELLTSRLYNHNKIEIYKQEAKIAKLFEFFFDNPKEMEKYYFNHDLPGLIKYMEQFEDRKTITNLILDIDSLYRLVEPMKSYYSVKIQLELYRIFRKKCKDPFKLKKFKNLVYKNRIVEVLLKGETLNNRERNINT